MKKLTAILVSLAAIFTLVTATGASALTEREMGSSFTITEKNPSAVYPQALAGRAMRAVRCEIGTGETEKNNYADIRVIGYQAKKSNGCPFTTGARDRLYDIFGPNGFTYIRIAGCKKNKNSRPAIEFYVPEEGNPLHITCDYLQ